MNANQTQQHGRNEGCRRKDAAHDLFECHREALLRLARRAFLQTLLANGKATADDVREAVELPDGIDPKMFGAVAKSFAKSSVVEPIGFVASCRPIAHCRPIRIWQLKDRAAAEKWLQTHPELSAVTTADQLPLFDQKKNPSAATDGPLNPSSDQTGKDSNHG